MVDRRFGYKSSYAYDIMRSFNILDSVRKGEIDPPHSSVAYDKWCKKNKIFLSQSELRSYMAGKCKPVEKIYFPVEDGTVYLADVFKSGFDCSENLMRIVRGMSSTVPVSISWYAWCPDNSKIECEDVGRTMHYTEIGDLAFLAYQDALRKGSVAIMRPEHGPNKEV